MLEIDIFLTVSIDDVTHEDDSLDETRITNIISWTKNCGCSYFYDEIFVKVDRAWSITYYGSFRRFPFGNFLAMLRQISWKDPASVQVIYRYLGDPIFRIATLKQDNIIPLREQGFAEGDFQPFR